MSFASSASKMCVLAVAVLATVTGCADDSEREIEALVRVTVCVENGDKCFALGVPSATVTVESNSATVAEATTDAAGAVRFTLASGQTPVKLVARSPLFNGGVAETSLPPPSKSTSVTLNAPLAEQARPH